MARLVFTLNDYSPPDAEATIGVAQVKQRDWRRRGLIRTHKGNARYNVFEMAELLMMQHIANAGFPLAEAAIVARSVAAPVVMYSLTHQEDFEGTPDALQYFHDIGNDEENGPGALVLAALGIAVEEPRRFLIFWSNGQIQFTDSIDRALEDPSRIISMAAIQRQSGVSKFSDLKLIGGPINRLAEVTGRAPVHVSIVEPDRPS